MSANITMTNGKAEAAYAKRPAWHGLGVVFQEIITDADEMLRLSGCDWEVVQARVATEVVGDQAPEGPVPFSPATRWSPSDSHRVNIRQDTGLRLGIVGRGYQVVQNREAFRFLTTLVQDRAIEFESAFSLYGGKRVVVTSRMPQRDEILPGDTTERYILMSLGHDGTSAITFGVTQVRVVCSNTYQMAIQDPKGNVRQLNLRHTGKLEEKLDEAREILGLASDGFDAHAAQCRELARRVLTVEQWAEFLDILCPTLNQNDPDWTERRDRAVRKTRDAIVHLFRQGPLNNLPGMSGTAWAALNAVTEHIDHLPRRGADKRRRAEARFNVTQYGAGRSQKVRAMEALRRICQIGA